ncbi:unannotated protein [freshwater metagenome]|uniref:Unannotated protein n=1 Tax=freshwater metagenome TaxID=449393 RepID=A0A6J7HH73_9ZZZZ|nr:glucose 1-dehydrogenase [Actinomycetota bacterium]
MTSISELFSLSGKRAIVTGGGVGLGLQFATGLAEAGADVVLCGRNEERCIEAANAIAQAHGVRAIGVRCDVRDPDSVNAVVATAVEQLGGVDILVNNAGASWGAPTEEFPLDGWNKVMTVNVTGSWLFAQAVGRHLVEAGRPGRIINLSSVLALQGVKAGSVDAIAYNTSKGAVISMTRDLAVKWAPKGITVNAIAPGWFPSDMSNVSLEKNNESFLGRIPMGRFGSDDDLKGLAVFLASDAAAYVTGQTILVDGGLGVS